MTTERRYPIGEVAFILKRKPHTVRVWAYQDKLPEHLLPHRDDRGHRYWTDEQVSGLQQWIIDEDMRPGKSLRQRKANSGLQDN